ncbi:MAG: hypothetical protein NTW16_05025 [Bacteroidetes bacterium]|nr:hypothetical protein [Bacteroidota bacterium]
MAALPHNKLIADRLFCSLGYPFPFPTDNTEAICYRPSDGTVVINPMFNYLHSWDGSSYTSLNFNNSRSRGLTEDSQNRLWSLGENSGLSYYTDANQTWTSVPFLGTGNGIRKDPTRPGTIWACSGYEALRTDGNYNSVFLSRQQRNTGRCYYTPCLYVGRAYLVYKFSEY